MVYSARKVSNLEVKGRGKKGQEEMNGVVCGVKDRYQHLKEERREQKKDGKCLNEDLHVKLSVTLNGNKHSAPFMSSN